MKIIMAYEKDISPFESPVYEQVFPDLVLIGVHHKDVKPKGKDVYKLERKLDCLNHLAFEGTENTQKYMVEINARNYEFKAFNYFKGRKHFLDEGVDYTAILSSQRVQKPIIAVCQILRNIREIIDAGKNGKFTQALKTYLKRTEQTIPGFSNLKTDEILEAFPYLMEKMGNSTVHEDCMLASFKFTEYRSLLRDVKIYGPKISTMRTLEGNKGAIVGGGHIKNLKAFLTGNIGSDVILWEEYVNNLDNASRRGFGILEEWAMIHCNGSKK
ncbi:MAG: hypothetical protein AABX96_02480 [Nanoarchaeota archaeon]